MSQDGALPRTPQGSVFQYILSAKSRIFFPGKEDGKKRAKAYWTYSETGFFRLTPPGGKRRLCSRNVLKNRPRDLTSLDPALGGGMAGRQNTKGMRWLNVTPFRAYPALRSRARRTDVR